MGKLHFVLSQPPVMKPDGTEAEHVCHSLALVQWQLQVAAPGAFDDETITALLHLADNVQALVLGLDVRWLGRGR